jgi:hypothetical protein
MFKHVRDIDRKRQVALNDLDSRQSAAVHRVALALDDAKQPNVMTATLLADVLRSYLGTHSSIRLLLDQRNQHPEFGADAVSLVREQIEKVFLTSLFLADWQKYVPIYFEEDWCRKYRYFLIDKQERQDLTRSKEFFDKYGPKHFESRRRHLGISPLVKELVEFQVANPGKEVPKHLKNVLLPRLPTPGQVLKVVPAANRTFLSRWHEEYVLVCGYTHIGADKLHMTTATGRKVNIPADEIRAFFDAVIVEKAFLSYVACAVTATELLVYTGGALEPLAEVIRFWNLLLEASLIARVFWEIRSRALVPGAQLAGSQS